MPGGDNDDNGHNNDDNNDVMDENDGGDTRQRNDERDSYSWLSQARDTMLWQALEDAFVKRSPETPNETH